MWLLDSFVFCRDVPRGGYFGTCGDTCLKMVMNLHHDTPDSRLCADKGPNGCPLWRFRAFVNCYEKWEIGNFPLYTRDEWDKFGERLKLIQVNWNNEYNED